MDTKRQNKVTFRLTDAEIEQFKKQVAASGLNQQKFIAACIFDKKIINTSGLDTAANELKRVGTNVNQIARKINSNGFNNLKAELNQLGKELNNIWLLLKQYEPKAKADWEQ